MIKGSGYVSVDTMWQEIRMLKARVCALEKSLGSTAGLLQFVVGEAIDLAYFTGNISNVLLPSDGGDLLIIHEPIKQNSILVTLDGAVVAKGRGDRASYLIQYYDDRVEIRKTGLPFTNTQLYLITYDHL